MTFTQMEYALFASEYGSINKAAKVLFVSQPHLSKSIQSMEAEVGYQIFKRFPQGIEVTEKGRLFLNHCAVILQEYKKVQLLAELKQFHSFHLAVGSQQFFTDAFTRLCIDYQDSDVLDLRIHQKNQPWIIEEVYQGICHLGLVIVPEASVKNFIHEMNNKDLNARALHHLELVVTLRKEHPFFQKDDKDLSRLSQYPFVDYSRRNAFDTLSAFNKDLAGLKKLILVHDKESRHQILAKTNAYSIGCAFQKELLDHYQLKTIPLDDPGYRILYIHRTDTPLSEESRRYLKHLKEIIAENL